MERELLAKPSFRQTRKATEANTGVVAFPLIARLLALGGAALFAVAAWLPWVIVTAAPAGDGLSSSERLALTPGTVGAPPLNTTLPGQGAVFVWSALTVLGIPLAALAWMRLSRSLAWLIGGAYGLWLLVTAIFSITSARYLLQSTNLSYQNIAGATESTSVQVLFDGSSSHDPQIGLWLSGLALLICLAGLWTLIAAARPMDPSAGPSVASARPAAQAPGALTFGLVLWAVGFLWMAWASLGCPSFVLVSATCQGLSADGAMTYAISRADFAFDPRVGEYAISILLTVGALLIAIGVWRRGVSTALCGWATVWLVVAAAFGALAWYGINLVVNDPTLKGAAAVSWRGESGILFTAGALLIYLVGVGLLWFALLFHRTQTSSA
jgi:hypothetical protein